MAFMWFIQGEVREFTVLIMMKILLQMITGMNGIMRANRARKTTSGISIREVQRLQIHLQLLQARILSGWPFCRTVPAAFLLKKDGVLVRISVRCSKAVEI